tara:strand:- start:120 stop:485 length:366 start_codon:yes stop_codon:yes gene_type:complete
MTKKTKVSAKEMAVIRARFFHTNMSVSKKMQAAASSSAQGRSELDSPQSSDLDSEGSHSTLSSGQSQDLKQDRPKWSTNTRHYDHGLYEPMHTLSIPSLVNENNRLQNCVKKDDLQKKWKI